MHNCGAPRKLVFYKGEYRILIYILIFLSFLYVPQVVTILTHALALTPSSCLSYNTCLYLATWKNTSLYQRRIPLIGIDWCTNAYIWLLTSDTLNVNYEGQDLLGNFASKAKQATIPENYTRVRLHVWFLLVIMFYHNYLYLLMPRSYLDYKYSQRIKGSINAGISSDIIIYPPFSPLT